MSRTLFIEYDRRGFWAYDVASGIFLKHLIDAALSHDSVVDRDWLAASVQEWRITIVLGHMGMVIDEGWDARELAIFVELADQACHVLAERESIGRDEIVAWPISGDEHMFTRGAEVVETAPTIELGRAIIALIDGSLPAPPPNTAWFYGSPHGRDVIGMDSKFQWDNFDDRAP